MPKLSPRRLAANRANAARSTGPRTPQGKARSAQNARIHGLTAANLEIVSLQELDAVARLKDDLVAFYQPVNPQELLALERIAFAHQAFLRSATLGPQLQARKPNGLALFLRYQAQTERRYRRALKEFDLLRSLYEEFPNEPNSEPKPEENTPLAPPATNRIEPPAAPPPAAPRQPPAFVGQAVSLRRVVNPPSAQFAKSALPDCPRSRAASIPALR